MTAPSPPTLPRDLGDGLVMRRATPADADALAAFNADTHRYPNASGPNEEVAVWTRDLLRGTHPTVAPGDTLVVEDRRDGTIASTMLLISQTWSYDGIPFGLGRPELVATRPDYRRRGLVRRQFEIVHAWSAARGELAQGITGIPWYYRQFGYEMTVELDGGRSADESALPKLAAGEAEPYRVREATVDDLAFIAATDAHGAARGPLACARDGAAWRYQLDGRTPGSAMWRALRIVERPDGAPVGFFSHPGSLWDRAIWADRYELAPGISWGAATPSVMRALWATGREYAARTGKECLRCGFLLGSAHPVYAAFPNGLPIERRPYAWFLRVPDLPAFVRHVAPALEARLARSPLAGHSGDLELSFYRDGLRLRFADGRLTLAERWTPTPERDGNAGFPEQTFLHLLFGHRSFEELAYIYPDCWTNGARALLDALFPKRPSAVWALA